MKYYQDPIISGSTAFGGPVNITGTLDATSSLSISSSFALEATSASYAENSTSSSYALEATSASYSENSTSASYALTSSYSPYQERDVISLTMSSNQSATTGTVLFNTLEFKRGGLNHINGVVLGFKPDAVYECTAYVCSNNTASYIRFKWLKDDTTLVGNEGLSASSDRGGIYEIQPVANFIGTGLTSMRVNIIMASAGDGVYAAKSYLIIKEI